MSPVTEFAERVSASYAKEITDQIFLLIQNNHDLMYEYLHLVEQHGVTSVNQQIGKHIKTRFSLTNDDSRQDLPKSVLIQSHQEFL